jgi:hypothetical protein
MRLIPVENYFIATGLLILAAFALFAWRRKPISLSLVFFLFLSISFSLSRKIAFGVLLIILFCASSFYNFYSTLTTGVYNYWDFNKDAAVGEFSLLIQQSVNIKTPRGGYAKLKDDPAPR